MNGVFRKGTTVNLAEPWAECSYKEALSSQVGEQSFQKENTLSMKAARHNN